MSKNQDKNIKNFTRGGQITLHNFRMFLQIMDKICWIAAGVFLIVTLSISFIQISDYERYVLAEYTWSNVTPILSPGAKTEFIQPNGIEKVLLSIVIYKLLHW